jgi:signal peptidase I
MRTARRISRALSALVVAAGVAFGALLVLPALAGWQRYVIVTGSMTGTYDRGSLVLDDVVPVSSLKVGDVITYKPPSGSGVDHLVTHRIHAVTRDPQGARVFRTKGDANPVADPWTFSLGGPRQARVRAGIPYVGFAVEALSDRRARMLLVGLPAALIALTSLAGLWKEAGESADADSRGVRLAPNSRRDVGST